MPFNVIIAIHIYSVLVSGQIFCLFLINFFLLLRACFSFWIQILYQIHDLQIFAPILWLCIHSLNNVIQWAEFFILTRLKIKNFWFIILVRIPNRGTSLVVQWLRLQTSSAGGLGSSLVGELDPTCCNQNIPCAATKILHSWRNTFFFKVTEFKMHVFFKEFLTANVTQ